MNFYIVDVFAESKYTGNQLAVFTGPEVAKLSDTEMLQIAREMNYSETTFITNSEAKEGGYDVRIFTPKKELPFAGHPTLGTAYILREKVLKTPTQQVILNLKVGQIPVNWDDKNILWMEQNQPSFGGKLNPEILREVLNLNSDDIDPKFPIQSVSTGVPFLIIPLKTHDALKKAQVNLEKYAELIQMGETGEILIFCPETYHPQNNLSVRVFAPRLGITEDPATGSANGCLAGYLVKYSYFGKAEIDVRVEQGYEINRPSLLFLKSKKNRSKIDILVGGSVVEIAQGQFV